MQRGPSLWSKKNQEPFLAPITRKTGARMGPIAPNSEVGCSHRRIMAQLGRIDGWWNEKSKIKTVPLIGDSSRGVEDAFQSFRRQRLWRESRCWRIARDFLSLTGPSLLSRGTRLFWRTEQGAESLGHPPSS